LLAVAAGDHERAERSGLVFDAADGWRDVAPRDPEAADLVALYLPFLQPVSAQAGFRAVAHLGQSLDGCVATHDGDACFVTGEANIVHLHRMRALADAVIVGAGTAANDDPQLTTRLVPGPNPVRVIVDPKARLSPNLRVFADAAAPTLHCCDAVLEGGAVLDAAERLQVPACSRADGGGLDLSALCERLRARGLVRLFVEGGGVTVSRFLSGGLLDRLQIAVAPLIIGRGRPGISLPCVPRLSEALRPASRVFRMGADVLYDLDLGRVPGPEEASDQTLALVRAGRAISGAVERFE
jgi:riboflavin-specific deaminase-like protein